MAPIKTLIDLENQYGQKTIEQTAQKIADKNPDKPKRSIEYLVGIIKSIAKS